MRVPFFVPLNKGIRVDTSLSCLQGTYMVLDRLLSMVPGTMIQA